MTRDAMSRENIVSLATLLVLLSHMGASAPHGGNDLTPLSPLAPRRWPAPTASSATPAPAAPPPTAPAPTSGGGSSRRSPLAAAVAARLLSPAGPASVAAATAPTAALAPAAPRRAAPSAYQRMLRTLACQRSAHPRACDAISLRVAPVPPAPRSANAVLKPSPGAGAEGLLKGGAEGEAEARALALPPGYVHVRGVGAYRLHLRRRAWPKAKATCEAEAPGAHLVVINSQREAQALAALMRPHRFLKFVLVGFSDARHEGAYLTVTGQTLQEAGYEKWKANEPNGFGGNEDCGSMTRNAELNDIFCDRPWQFICEVDIYG